MLEDADIDEIRRRLEVEPSIDRVYSVELRDSAGVAHAAVEKTIYIRKNR